MRSTAPCPAVSMDLRLLEEVLYDLPPLEGVFLHWHMQGMSATTAGIISLLARRKQLLGSTTLSGASIQLLYACAKDTFCSRPGQEPFSPWGSRPLHTRLLRHRPAHSAAEVQALLPPGVLVHKTISFTLANTIVLCTGVGTQCLTRRHLRTIAAALVRQGPNVKQRTINPAPGSSVKKLAMHPGLVSPFLHPSRHAGLAALALLPWSGSVGRARARGGDLSVAVGKSGTALVLSVPSHTQLRQAIVSCSADHRPGKSRYRRCRHRLDCGLACLCSFHMGNRWSTPQS